MNALQLNFWLKQHWKLLILIIVAVVLLGETIFQIVYPSSRLIPGTTVDGVSVGGLKYTEASKKLDDLYGSLKLKIYFGDNDAAFQTPKMQEVGIGVDNQARLENIKYPMYLRFIPGSMLWATSLSKPGQIEYTYDRNKISEYTTSKVGEDCNIPPQNATLKLIDSKLQLVPSISGGKCDINDLQKALAAVTPDSSVDNSVRIAIDEKQAPITDDIARDLAAKLNSRLAAPMPIKVDAKTDTIPGRVVLSWLDFVADVPEEQIDNSGNETARLLFNVNEKRMEDYLNQGIAAELIQQPVPNKVSTHDFTETSRKNGSAGRALDMPKAAKSVQDYINQKIRKAIGATKVVTQPTDYIRSYSPTSTGFSALLAQYDEDHVGSYSIAFQELSNVEHPRNASYHDTERLPAAGIHALFMAYTYNMEESDGIARPVDKISGSENARECFKDMIQKFDYKCRIGFYKYFGHATLTKRAAELGLKNTVYAGEDTLTSAGDLQLLLVGMYKNKVPREAKGQEILSRMQSSKINEGVPSVIDDYTVAHVIGESGDIRNDAAVLYNDRYGTYALSVMTKGASWEDIGGLVKKIEALKAVKIPRQTF